MMEYYIQALLKLVQAGKIAVEDIKDAEYKAEVERRLGQA